ncbi:MAG: carboxylating nicotinate-nucleotide diphosphorylase [Bacteroidales bacterium]|nr:carboxylating nicotinate-nucleotide diphosphorylase [Bacteroidales bacterium]
MQIDIKQIERFLDIAIAEDIGEGDHTSLATIAPDQYGKAILVAKERGVLAGVEIARMVFQKINAQLEFSLLKHDGDEIIEGDVIFEVKGNAIAILMAERLALNIVQRLSGIATQTREYVKKLEGFRTKILDTRKTTPGMRLLDKYAVRIGGGTNHRIGLYDMILIKDNHIDFAGGIEIAIERVHHYLREKGLNLKIEIEARSLDDVQKILNKGGVNCILLDNFTPQQTREAVALINGRYETESSGNINLQNVCEYAACGVDYISIGALTHQIRSVDFSLKVS